MDQPPGPGYYQATDGKWYPAQPPPQYAPQYAQPPQVVVQKSSGGAVVGGIAIGCAAFFLIGIVAVILIAALGASSTGNTGTASGTTLSGAALDAELAKAQPVDVDAVVKNPDAFKGKVFEMAVVVSQYDTATGACTFRGYWDATPHQFTSDYKGDNAVFTAGDGGRRCSGLEGIDTDDEVKVWAKGAGSMSYEAQIGGNRTVPSFEVLKAEVTAKK